MNNLQDNDKIREGLIAIIGKLILIIIVLVITLVAMPIIYFYSNKPKGIEEKKTDAAINTTGVKKDNSSYWMAPDPSAITDPALKMQVEYGKELISHTAKYFGPNGSVARISNGLNCQNCHLQAGTAVFGNNYGSVASLYPKFRARSGSVENIYKRVNDCFERSLNGKAIDTAGKEMQAIVAYINYLGTNVEKGKKAEGSGFKDLAFLDRATDPDKGQLVYTAKCQSCHQPNGEGLLNPEKTEFTFPALWGKSGFNDGAGLYRISNFAKYVKYNMPQGTTHENPQLSDEEAWDVAAFVVTRQRPHINVPKDWPDIAKKPVDHPFGPYADAFSEKQHKLGPFKPIAEEQKRKEVLKNKPTTAAVKK
ncbi:MAG: c-type cytochrome [Chitinophagaceae bacterium]|nr:c-type cytochrome [Chitinophagaceae bacterium]